MSLKSILKDDLKARGIAFKDLNKKANKQAKTEILERLTRRGIIEGYSKERLGKELRSIQINNKKFTFSNQQIRDIYNRTAVNSRQINPAKLRKSARPNPAKINKSKRSSGKPTGAYFYIVKVYLKSSVRQKKQKTKRLPLSHKKIIRVTNDTRYNHTQDFVLISEDVLTGNEVLDLAYREITGEGEGDSDISFNASGLKNIDFKIYTIVAFEYKAVVKDF